MFVYIYINIYTYIYIYLSKPLSVLCASPPVSVPSALQRLRLPTTHNRGPGITFADVNLTWWNGTFPWWVAYRVAGASGWTFNTDILCSLANSSLLCCKRFFFLKEATMWIFLLERRWVIPPDGGEDINAKEAKYRGNMLQWPINPHKLTPWQALQYRLGYIVLVLSIEGWPPAPKAALTWCVISSKGLLVIFPP